MTINAVVERISERGCKGAILNNLALLQDINSWQTSQEVFADWQKGAPVEGVNTANMGIYRIVNYEVIFDLLGREGNLFIPKKFRENVYNGIFGNEFFFPEGEMKDYVLSAINAGKSETIKYSGLKIKTEKCDPTYCYIQFGRKNTAEEKKLFYAVYGVENPGDGKEICLLRKNIVKKQLQKRKDDFVARACYFNGYQHFFPLVRDMSFYDWGSGVRGVRRRA